MIKNKKQKRKMSEETQDHNDGTWSGLKKTLIGVATTAITAGGVWLTTLLSGGGGEEAPAAVPAAAPVINITNSNQQAAPAASEKTVIIREKSVTPASAKPTPAKPKKDEHLEEEPKW